MLAYGKLSDSNWLELLKTEVPNLYLIPKLSKEAFLLLELREIPVGKNL